MTPLERKALEFIRDRTEGRDVKFGLPTKYEIEKFVPNVDTKHAILYLECQGWIEICPHRKPKSLKRYRITEEGRNAMRAVA